MPGLVSSYKLVTSDRGLMFTGTDRQVLPFLQELNGICRGEHMSIFGINTLEVLRRIAWTVAADYKGGTPTWVWNAGTPYDTVSLINIYSCSGAKTDGGMTVEQFVNYWVPDTRVVCKGMADAFKVDIAPAALEAGIVRTIASLMGF